MSEYRRFYNGKRYEKVSTVKTKARVEKIKKILQNQGSLIKVEKTGVGYTIYYRGKNFVKKFDKK